MLNLSQSVTYYFPNGTSLETLRAYGLKASRLALTDCKPRSVPRLQAAFMLRQARQRGMTIRRHVM